jgi:ABC-type multidrug transport system fused ATPase/permease subunit
MLKTVRLGLSLPELRLRDLPQLDAAFSPAAQLRAIFRRGGFSALLTRTRGLSLYPTLLYFAAFEWRLALSQGLAQLLSQGSLAAVPALVEALLHALEAARGGGAPLTACWWLVGGLFFAYGVNLLCMPAAWFLGTLLGLRAQSALLVLAAAKGALIARDARSQGEQAFVLSRYAPSLLPAFTGVQSSTWLPAASVVAGGVNLVRLLGAVAGLSALGLLAGLTAFAFWLRAAIKRAEKRSTALAQRRVALLGEAAGSALPLRAVGWDAWAAARILRVREDELRGLRAAQLTRVAVDALFSLTLPAVVLVAFEAYALTHGGVAPPPALAFSAITWLSFVASPLRALGAFLQITVDASVNLKYLAANVGAKREALTGHLGEWAAWEEEEGNEEEEKGTAGRDRSALLGGACAESAASPALRAVERALRVAVGGCGATPPAPRPPAPPGAPLLAFSGASIFASTAPTPSATPLLEGVTLSVAPGELVLLVGATGSGKSAVLRAIAGDAGVSGGSLAVTARVAYVPQDPWLQRGSVRDGVMGVVAEGWGVAAAPAGGGGDDDAWYREVLSACALNEDLASPTFPRGDDTQVGDGGCALSGGTRARLALARSLYAGARHVVSPAHPPSLFLVDDVLAAVDSPVGEVIWREALGRLIVGRGHGVLMATHALHFSARPGVARVAVLGGGGGSNGAPSRMLACGLFTEVAQFVDLTEGSIAGLEAARRGAVVEPQLPLPAPGAGLPTTGAVSAPAAAALDAQVKPSFAALRMYASSVGAVHCAALFSLFLLAQAFSVAQSFWLREWASGDFSGVPRWVWGVVGCSGAPAGAAESAAAAGIYGVAGGALTLLVVARTLVLTLCTLAAARALHARALGGLLGASAGALARLPLGAVLVRFEKDVDHVDSWVRPNVLLVTTAFFSVGGTLAVVSATAPGVLGWVAVLALLYAALGVVYKRVVLSLRSVDAAASSEVTGLWRELSATEAAATLRCAGPLGAAAGVLALLRAQAPALRTAVAADAGSQLAANLLFTAGATVMLSGAVAAVAAVSGGSLSPGSAGLLLSYAYSFPADMSTLVTNIGWLEQSSVSIARLAEFVGLPPADEGGKGTAIPRGGAEAHQQSASSEPQPLVVDNLWLRYADGAGSGGAAEAAATTAHGVQGDDLEAPLLGRDGGAAEEGGVARVVEDELGGSAPPPWVLRGFSAAIPAGAKVAVIGRTGCGKSSLFSALMRIWPHQRGAIRLGACELSALRTGAEVRERVAYLPQGGLLVSGTVRENLLGPLALPSSWDDARLLRFCGERVSPLLAARIGGEAGLDAEVVVEAVAPSAIVGGGGGSNGTSGTAASALPTPSASASGEWSRGERALLSLARLLLRQEVGQPAALLLMDEPSADVDVACDRALQSALLSRPETLLCIVHREENLPRFSHVMRVEGGRAARFEGSTEFLALR